MAKFEKKFDSIKDRNKTMDRIWGTKNGLGNIGHPRVKLIFHQEIEKTGRTKPAYITLEGDQEWIDAYKTIAFDGNGKFSDVVKQVEGQKNEGTIKLADLVTEGKKVTRATVKSMMKKLGVPEDKYELDSQDVTIWFSDIPEKKAKKIMSGLQDAFGGTLSGNGSKYWLNYKGKSVDMGDWNDKSSRWHY